MITAIIIIISTIEVVLIGSVVVLLKRTVRKNKISFQETLALTDLPIVTFYNNGRKLNFILDTGANESVLNERELSSCSYTLVNEKRNLMGIDGNNRSIDNLVSLKLTRGVQQFLEKFQVSNLSPVLDNIRKTCGVEVHGLIGNTFFTKYKYILDFDELAAYTH